MMQPERLARLVLKLVKGMELEPEDQSWLYHQCVKLLRREQARVRRIVKAQPKAKGYVDDLISRDDLLAALKKGTR